MYEETSVSTIFYSYSRLVTFCLYCWKLTRRRKHIVNNCGEYIDWSSVIPHYGTNRVGSEPLNCTLIHGFLLHLWRDQFLGKASSVWTGCTTSITSSLMKVTEKIKGCIEIISIVFTLCPLCSIALRRVHTTFEDILASGLISSFPVYTIILFTCPVAESLSTQVFMAYLVVYPLYCCNENLPLKSIHLLHLPLLPAQDCTGIQITTNTLTLYGMS